MGIWFAGRCTHSLGSSGTTIKESAVDLGELAPIVLAFVVIIWGKRW
jgi:hypothetical protein